MIFQWNRTWVFVVPLVAGAIVIFLIRSLLPGVVGAFVTAILCGGLIATIACFFYQREREKAVKSADDFYYLGLLFTLLSLIHVLIASFVLGASSEEQRTEQIIGNFGIALISTVVGIVVRVLLISRDSSDVEPTPDDGSFFLVDSNVKPDADVSEMVRALRDQLMQALSAMSHFNRVTLSQAHATKSHSERLVREFTDRIDQMSEERIKLLDETARKWDDSRSRILSQLTSMSDSAVQQLTVLLSLADETWRKFVQYATTAVDQARTQYQSTNQSFASLSENLNGVSTNLSSVGRELSELVHELQATKEESRGLKSTTMDSEATIRASASELRSTQTGAAKELSAFTQNIESLEALFEKLSRQLTNTVEKMGSFSNLVDNASGYANKLDKVTDTVEARLNEVMTSITNTQNLYGTSVAKISEFADSMTEITMSSLDLSENNAEQGKQAFVALNRMTYAFNNQVEQISSRFTDQSAAWTNAIQILNESIETQRQLLNQYEALANQSQQNQPEQSKTIWPRFGKK